MPRILVDFPEKDLIKLANHAKTYRSRAALIREIVECWLEQQGELEDQAFGILEANKIDGVTYQRKLREEW